MSRRKRGKLVKRNKIWHCHFFVNGQRVRQSLETRDWKEAESKLSELIAKAQDGKLTQTSATLARLPFTQAADEYVSTRMLELATASQAKEKQLLVQLRAYFKQEPLKVITVKRITDYRTWRADPEACEVLGTCCRRNKAPQRTEHHRAGDH
jgi:hypothetical protein